MVALILVDSNVWIFAELSDYPEHEVANEKLKAVFMQEKAVTNDVIVSEVYHKLTKEIGQELAAKRTMHMLFSDNVVYLPVSREEAVKAIGLSTKCSLRINDSIIAQQCLDNELAVLTDNVKDFKKVKGLRMMALRESR